MIKAIVNAFDHMEFCLVLHLTHISVDAKTAVKWQPKLLPGMLILLPAYLLPAKKLISNNEV